MQLKMLKMKTGREEKTMDINEVKKTLANYEELEKRAQAVLEAGSIHFGDVDSVRLEGDFVVVCYWATCRGETYHDEERLPVKMLADGTDVYAEWDKVRTEREQRQKKAEAAAKRAAKRAEKAEAKKKVKAYLTEIQHLKEQYPEMFKTIGC